jgi:hypothetical protein
VFCTSIEHAKRVAKLLPGAEPVYSSLGKSERRARLARFRTGETPIVTTVDLFNEGVDVPAANVLVFLRSTQSRTVFLQQLGRGLRRMLGKTSVLVLDFVANCDRLEMVADLWTRVRTVQRGGDEEEGELKIPDNGILEIDFGTLEFTEVAKHILDVVGAVREGYTAEIGVAQVQALAEKLGRTPTKAEFEAEGRAGNCMSVPTLCSFFGTFGEALIAAGYVPNVVAPVRARSAPSDVVDSLKDNELLELLRRLAEAKTGGRLNRQDVIQAHREGTIPVGYTELVKRFGGFSEALNRAGLKAKLSYNDDELLQQLRGLTQELGHTPTQEDISSAHGRCGSVNQFKRRFGSVGNAIKLAGEERVREKYSEAELLGYLRRLRTELGKNPTTVDIDDRSRQGQGPSRTAFQRWGTWSGALKAAGLK